MGTCSNPKPHNDKQTPGARVNQPPAVLSAEDKFLININQVSIKEVELDDKIKRYKIQLN